MKINLALVTLYGTTLGLTSLVPVGVWQSPGATDRMNYHPSRSLGSL